MSKFKISLFGALSISDPSGNQISVTGGKQQALLAFLALNSENCPSRDQVMTLLWGDRFTDQARQSLRQSLSKLRQCFDTHIGDVIWATQDRIGLNLDLVQIDVSDFIKNAMANTGEADQNAAESYKGELLDGLFLRESSFEDWITIERERLCNLAIPVFERLALQYLQNKDQVKSQETALRLIEIDTLRESSHRLMMQIMAQSGQRASAIRQYQTCVDILKHELDVDPEPETQALLEKIKSPELVAAPKPISSASVDLPTNQMADKTSKTSVTILPFLFSGQNADLMSFTDGLTEDTMLAVTKFRWLDVMASLPIENGDVSTAKLRQLATEHNVMYSIEGSVRQIANKLRISIHLVDLETGTYIWVNRYDRDIDDLLDIQDELPETIAATAESELVAFEGAKARSKEEGALGAWDCYHLGLATQYEFSEESNSKAQSLFRRAIALDPMFAAAHARLSYAMVLSSIYFEADVESGIFDEALTLAKRATQLDEKDATARFALGRVKLARGEYEESISELRMAINLNPGFAQAHCGLGDSLAYLGRTDEAIPSFEEAIRLSPQDPHRWAFLMYASLASVFEQDFERAAKWAKRAVQVPNSHFWADAALVSALGHLGHQDEAVAAREILLEKKPNFSCAFARDRLFYLKDKTQVETYVEGLSKAGVC